MKMKMLFLTTAIMVDMVFSSSAKATIDWNYDSPLTVYETVTDIGMGYCRYEYSFTNTDTSPIWRFGVFTKFLTYDETTFQGFGWLKPINVSVLTYPQYDGSILDDRISSYTVTDYELGFVGIDTYAIHPGESAYGFSFVGQIDFSPYRYYFYETIESGYALTNNTGNVAAVGMTVPEPCTILLLTCGCIILRKRIRS